MTSSAPIHIPPSIVSFSPGTVENKGFVPVPRDLFDLMLCHDFGKRELRLFLLIICLTYGCRGNQWAFLRPGDLSAIGIHPSHARLCLRKLLSTRLILRDGDSHRYRANPKWVVTNSENEEAEMAARIQQLRALIGRHIGRSRTLPSTDRVFSATDQRSALLEGSSEQKAQPTADVKAERIVKNDLADTNPTSKRWRFDRQQERFLRAPSSQTVPFSPSDGDDMLGHSVGELFASLPTHPFNAPS